MEALKDILPLIGGGGWIAAAYLYLALRKIRIAENASDQKLREASQALLMEAADKLSHAPEYAHERAECVNLLAAWVRAQTGQEWNIVERDTVAFLKRMGAGAMLDGVLLMSDHEVRE